MMLGRKITSFLDKLFGKNKDLSMEDDLPLTDDHPWKGDLDHLASKFGEADDNLTPRFDASPVNDAQLEDEFDRLCEEIKKSYGTEESARKIEQLKERRRQTRQASTAVDIKAWWGQSVATWDPIDGKNIDSIEKLRRPKRSKWFE